MEDRKPSHRLVWNKLPENQQTEIIELALERPELSPQELAVACTDEQSSFVSESTVYRLLKAHDLITSPVYIFMEAAGKFSTQRRVSRKCGKSISPIAKLSVGAGISCQQCWMTSPGLFTWQLCKP